jgi:hypothetical protein
MESILEAMKNLVLLALLIGFILPHQPANAATSCKTVKSKVLAIEKKISAGLNEMKSRPSFTYIWFDSVYTNYFIQRGSAEDARNEKIRTEGFKLLESLWKLGTNNPKCFTNTQKIRLKDPRFKMWLDYYSPQFSDVALRNSPQYIPNTTYQSDYEWLERHWVYQISNYKSIYRY